MSVPANHENQIQTNQSPHGRQKPGKAQTAKSVERAGAWQFTNFMTQQDLKLMREDANWIHLATAELHQAAEFIAMDRILRNCATAIGLKVFP